MASDSAYVDPDILVAAALVGFVVAVVAPLLSEALGIVATMGALGGGLLAAGLLGRQRDGLHRALFVGLAPAAGLTLTQLLRQSASSRWFVFHARMGLAIGLFVAFFGYSVGTIEYWLSDGTPSPRRREVARFAGFVLVGLALLVAVRVFAYEGPPPVRGKLQ